MQAFFLNIQDSLTIQQAVWQMSFYPHHSWTLLFHPSSNGYTAVVALQYLILKLCTSGFPVESPLGRKTFSRCMCSYTMVMSGWNTNGLLRTAILLRRSVLPSVHSVNLKQISFCYLNSEMLSFKRKKHQQILLCGS